MTIDPHLVIALLITALFLLGLFQWRFSGRLRTITLIGMAAIVSVVVSGDPSSLVLLSLSIILTAGTWRLSQNASICGTIGVVWISVLVACLVTVKVLNVGGSTIGFAWLGISYLIFRL